MTGTARPLATSSSAGAVTHSDRRLSGMTTGRLLIGATPLGQPSDASARLVKALASADVIAAEDTRRIRTLAQALDVKPGRQGGQPVRPERGDAGAGAGRRDRRRGDGAAGQRRRHAADQRSRATGWSRRASRPGLPVQCLPGPSAVTTALAVSGLPSERFCFEGFAPRKHSARVSWLETLAAEPRTCVFFESPRRLAETAARRRRGARARPRARSSAGS